ncbi:hypothetical protein HK100_002947 [Physocladia obscura]|uniref:J domain-containing protein n=1 Tax=Physocladia obscura TaxID=109957 RepID=A0AAD5SUR3_9FUNG|nr:hypothetical protein HK100_002947 [Physocladia obscura]
MSIDAPPPIPTHFEFDLSDGGLIEVPTDQCHKIHQLHKVILNELTIYYGADDVIRKGIRLANIYIHVGDNPVPVPPKTTIHQFWTVCMIITQTATTLSSVAETSSSSTAGAATLLPLQGSSGTPPNPAQENELQPNQNPRDIGKKTYHRNPPITPIPVTIYVKQCNGGGVVRKNFNVANFNILEDLQAEMQLRMGRYLTPDTDYRFYLVFDGVATEAVDCDADLLAAKELYKGGFELVCTAVLRPPNPAQENEPDQPIQPNPIAPDVGGGGGVPQIPDGEDLNDSDEDQHDDRDDEQHDLIQRSSMHIRTSDGNSQKALERLCNSATDLAALKQQQALPIQPPGFNLPYDIKAKAQISVSFGSVKPEQPSQPSIGDLSATIMNERSQGFQEGTTQRDHHRDERHEGDWVRRTIHKTYHTEDTKSKEIVNRGTTTEEGRVIETVDLEQSTKTKRIHSSTHVEKKVVGIMLHPDKWAGRDVVNEHNHKDILRMKTVKAQDGSALRVRNSPTEYADGVTVQTTDYVMAELHYLSLTQSGDGPEHATSEWVVTGVGGFQTTHTKDPTISVQNILGIEAKVQHNRQLISEGTFKGAQRETVSTRVSDVKTYTGLDNKPLAEVTTSDDLGKTVYSVDVVQTREMYRADNSQSIHGDVTGKERVSSTLAVAGNYQRAGNISTSGNTKVQIFEKGVYNHESKSTSSGDGIVPMLQAPGSLFNPVQSDHSISSRTTRTRTLGIFVDQNEEKVEVVNSDGALQVNSTQSITTFSPAAQAAIGGVAAAAASGVIAACMGGKVDAKREAIKVGLAAAEGVLATTARQALPPSIAPIAEVGLIAAAVAGREAFDGNGLVNAAGRIGIAGARAASSKVAANTAAKAAKAAAKEIAQNAGVAAVSQASRYAAAAKCLPCVVSSAFDVGFAVYNDERWNEKNAVEKASVVAEAAASNIAAFTVAGAVSAALPTVEVVGGFSVAAATFTGAAIIALPAAAAVVAAVGGSLLTKAVWSWVRSALTPDQELKRFKELAAILGLTFEESEADIRKKMRKDLRKYHPDKGGSSEEFAARMVLYEEFLKLKLKFAASQAEQKKVDSGPNLTDGTSIANTVRDITCLLNWVSLAKFITRFRQKSYGQYTLLEKLDNLLGNFKKMEHENWHHDVRAFNEEIIPRLLIEAA